MRDPSMFYVQKGNYNFLSYKINWIWFVNNIIILHNLLGKMAEKTRLYVESNC